MHSFTRMVLLFALGVILAENAYSQDTLPCEIEMDNHEIVGKDSLSGVEISIYTQHNNIFNWAWEALILLMIIRIICCVTVTI